MKRNYFNKWAAAVLTFTMLLTGCGQAADSNATDNEILPESAAETDSEVKGDSASSEVASESSGDRQTLKLFVDETWWPYDSWNGRIPEMVSEKLGIDIEVTVAADDTAMNLMIASGEMGDLVCTGKFGRMSDSNVCYSLDELAEMAGEELELHSVLRYVNTADDGNIYTVMAGFSPECDMKQYDKAVYEGPGLAVRTDIYEELGSPEVKDLDDFEALLAQVKEKYPDKIPFIYNSVHNNNFIKVLFGATTGSEGFIDMDGKAVPFIKDPNLKAYYATMNEWYRKGYMSDENLAFTSDDNDLEYMISDKVFAVSKYCDTENVFNGRMEKAGCDFTVTQLIDLTNMDGAKFHQTTAGWRGLFVPKSCSNPELAYKFIKFALSWEGQELMQWGEEGVDWEWSEDKSYPVMKYDFDNPNTEEGVKYWGWMYHNSVTNSIPGYENGGATYAAKKAITDIAEVNPILGMLRLNADSEEQAIMKNLSELYKTKSVEIITAPSAEASEKLYEEMLTTADELGIEKLEEWAVPRYEEKKAGYDAIKDNEK